MLFFIALKCCFISVLCIIGNALTLYVDAHLFARCEHDNWHKTPCTLYYEYLQYGRGPYADIVGWKASLMQVPLAIGVQKWLMS